MDDEFPYTLLLVVAGVFPCPQEMIDPHGAKVLSCGLKQWKKSVA